MITTLGSKEVVGRKEHSCSLCLNPIPKGETHATERCADESSVWTWRAHLKCNANYGAYWASVGVELSELDEYDQVDHGEFRDFMANLDNDPDPCITDG